MGTILYVLVPIPTFDSHDRLSRHVTVIATGPSLFTPAFLMSVDLPERSAGIIPVSLLYSFFTLRFYGVHYETWSHEPLRSDIPRRDSLCLARIIFIKSLTLMMA
jgi:hypothetical protein